MKPSTKQIADTNQHHPRNALLLIVLISVVVRLIAAFYLGNDIVSLPGIDDQRSYHMLALRVMTGHGFTVPVDWWPMTRAGEPTAHWSYLYTVYLIAVYRLFGVIPIIARIIQAVLSGVLWPVLTYRIARRLLVEGNIPQAQKLAGSATIVAATWSALYPYFVYYSAALLTEPFYILAVLWMFDLALDLTSTLTQASSRKILIAKWLLLGVAIGVAVLLRQLILFFVPFLFIWMAWASQTGALQTPVNPLPSGSSRSTLRHWLAVAGGAALACLVVAVFIAPWTLLNYQNFHRFVLLNTNAGFAFFWSNHPIYGTHFVGLLTDTSYTSLVPAPLRSLDEASLSSALFQLGLRQILDDPVRYILLSLSRLQTYFMFWPSSDSGLLSNVTRVASFGLALPFMLYGLVLSLQSWRRWSLLYVFILVYSAIHLLSWAIIRYRLPMDAVLLVFAAYGLVQLVDRLRHGLQVTNIQVNSTSS